MEFSNSGAASRIDDTRLIVFATPVEIEPFHLHGQQKKRVIALRFNGRHYDLLKGTGGKLPKDILEIKGKPEEVPQRLRGGGDDASVWTRSSARSSGSRSKSAPSLRAATAASVGARASTAPVRAPLPSLCASFSRAAAASRTCDSVASSLDGGVDAAPVVEEPARQTRRMNHLARQADGTYKEPCSYCAHVHVSDSAVKLKNIRYNHHQRWHKDLPRTHGRGLRRGFELRELGPDEAADWRCPMPGCRIAAPAGHKARVSKALFAEAREEHRRRAHRHLSRAAYAAKLRAAAHKPPAERMRCRVRMLNRFRAKATQSHRDGAFCPSTRDFVPFTWPQVLRRKGGKGPGKLRLTLASAWRCRSCIGCWEACQGGGEA